MFPKEIKTIIKNLDIKSYDDFHVSGDMVYNVGDKYILKTSNQVERLEKEYNKDLWIEKYIISAKPILFIKENNTAFYLREYIKGDNLCDYKYLSNPDLLIELLVEASNIFNTALIPLEDKLAGKRLVHGDFCLPNILVLDNKVVGFIDLGDADISDPWIDYAWMIWSFEYNLGTNKHTPKLLEKLGIAFDEEKYNKYING